MKSSRNTSLLIAVIGTMFISACGSSDVGSDQLRRVSKGTTQAELLEMLGQGPLVGSGNESLRVVNGFRRQEFLAAGDRYEIIWYRTEPGSLAEPIVKERETPIMMHADTVIGWGWSYFQERARALDLPDPTRGQERLDSIARSQAPKS